MSLSPDAALESCLAAVRDLSDRLVADLSTLSPERWDALTNCAPWRVRDLAVHLAVGGRAFATSVRQGLAGSVAPPSGEARRRLETALSDAGPATVAEALRTATDDFLGLYEDLTAEQSATVCFHRRGNRSVRWYAYHRLAEVAFHSWDMHLALGQETTFSESVALLLLPTLLESNAPSTYAAGLTPERGRGERYLLRVVDQPSSCWLVTIGPDRLEAVRGEAPADLTLIGSAATLALLAYGRCDPEAAVATGALVVGGDASRLERFRLTFPRP